MSTVTELEIHDELGMPMNYLKIKALEDSIRKDIISDENSLHCAITPVIKLAHLIGLFPVRGFQEQNTSYLFFKWFSWQMLYVFSLILLRIILIGCIIVKLYRNGLTYKAIEKLLLYISSLMLYILFIHLAREWPKLMAKWELMEREMIQFGQPRNIALKLKIITSIIMTFNIIQYSIIFANIVYNAHFCVTDGIDISRVLLAMHYIQIDGITHYSLVIFLSLEFLNLLLQFAWNFMDLFIITIACALTDKFKQFNRKLDTVNGKVLPSTYWRKSREYFNILASLTRNIDEFLSPVILLSFAHNLYYICFHLLKTLIHTSNNLEILCFLFLLTSIIGRMCAIFLYVASINDQSKKPKAVLFSVPTECYGVEVERFLLQVTSEELALTGYNFFSVTRTFMLTVVGTIATYEIVLIQFNNVANQMVPGNKTYLHCLELLNN